MAEDDKEAVIRIRKELIESLSGLQDALIEAREDNNSDEMAVLPKQISLIEQALDTLTDVVIDDNVDQKGMVDAVLRLALRK